MLDTQSLLIRAGELGISSTHAHQALAEGGCEALARLICETQPRVERVEITEPLVPGYLDSDGTFQPINQPRAAEQVTYSVNGLPVTNERYTRTLETGIKRGKMSPAQETEDDE